MINNRQTYYYALQFRQTRIKMFHFSVSVQCVRYVALARWRHEHPQQTHTRPSGEDYARPLNYRLVPSFLTNPQTQEKTNSEIQSFLKIIINNFWTERSQTARLLLKWTQKGRHKMKNESHVSPLCYFSNGRRKTTKKRDVTQKLVTRQKDKTDCPYIPNANTFGNVRQDVNIKKVQCAKPPPPKKKI